MATIAGNVKNVAKQIAQVPVRFHPVSQSVVDSESAIWTGFDIRTRSDENGDFSAELALGDYQLIIGEKDIFLISVPDNDLSYNFRARIVGNYVYNPEAPTVVDMPPVTNMRVNNGKWQILNITTNLFHDFYLQGPDGSPVPAWSPNGEA
jgi:hypothetical protein